MCLIWTNLNYRITGHLGSGQFGSVKEGTWSTENYPLKVALKTLNQDTTKENKVKFLQEAAIMAQFRHPNIVLLYGIVSREEPVSQQMRYMEVVTILLHNYRSHLLFNW